MESRHGEVKQLLKLSFLKIIYTCASGAFAETEGGEVNKRKLQNENWSKTK
jgi:hypothetical protein